MLKQVISYGANPLQSELSFGYRVGKSIRRAACRAAEAVGDGTRLLKAELAISISDSPTGYLALSNLGPLTAVDGGRKGGSPCSAPFGGGFLTRPFAFRHSADRAREINQHRREGVGSVGRGGEEIGEVANDSRQPPTAY